MNIADIDRRKKGGMSAIPVRVHLDLPPRMSSRGPRYTVRLNSTDGEILITDSLVPFFDAARVLQAKGVTGQFEMWDTTRAYPRMRADIAWAAKLTVKENETTSPRIVRWMPFAVARERPKTADQPSGPPEYPPDKTAAGESRAPSRAA